MPRQIARIKRTVHDVSVCDTSFHSVFHCLILFGENFLFNLTIFFFYAIIEKHLGRLAIYRLFRA
ncbi:MAG: hypothetical protein RSF84_09140, partial [Ruthenibacterium sp.]